MCEPSIAVFVELSYLTYSKIEQKNSLDHFHVGVIKTPHSSVTTPDSLQDFTDEIASSPSKQIKYEKEHI